MPSIKGTNERRDKHDKSKRSHRDSVSSSVGKQSTKVKSKSNSSKHASGSSLRQNHRHSISQVDYTGTESSDEEEDFVEDHQAVLAASRGRRSTPSVVSTLTSLTATTNTSNGSSGSNSTVTQASMTRHIRSAPREESNAGSPMSPAPDPPDVFAFLEKDSSPEENDDDDMPESQWLPEHMSLAYQHGSMQPTVTSRENASMTSSVSSSFHSDAASEHAGDNDTDRSSSPERSVKGEEQNNADVVPPSPTAAKLAAQMEAARQRQDLHSNMQNYGKAQLAPPPTVLIHPPQPSDIGPLAYSHMHPRFPPQSEKLPVTGYEALASKLASSAVSSDEPVRPIYRRFEALNHRMLLQLQDELAELEEQLHRLGGADTQCRSIKEPAGEKLRVLPESRRASAQAGGNLEWHKINLFNQISVKLSQYNQTLTSFNNLMQTGPSPEVDDVARYRSYVAAKKPIVGEEMRFLDATKDLVVVGKIKARAQAIGLASSSPTELAPHQLPTLPSLATAVAAAVLIPILTFAVIPGFLGRMTVVLLVASGIVGAVVQSGVDAHNLLGREYVTCATIYGVAMAIIACVC